MEEVSRIQKEVFIPRDETAAVTEVPAWKSYLPAILALGGSFVMLGLRFQVGSGFISDTALMMLALASYILAALFELTNLYAPSEMAKRIGLWSACLGVFFNFSSWLVRWVNAWEFELIQLQASGNTDADPWIFRYIPFANLYDLSLAFAFGAGITTLVLAHRKNFQFLSAFTLPLAALILTLARFIGGEHSNLMPILDSYWRPIHVGVASLSYGVALVCFAVAVVYLLKDRVKVETMAIFSNLFSIAVIISISGASVLTAAAYRSGTFIPNPTGGKPFNAFFRYELPYVGMILAISGVLLLAVTVAFLLYIYQNNEKARQIGHILLKAALVAQIVAVGFWVTGIKSTTDVQAGLQAQLQKNPAQFMAVGKELASKENLSVQQMAAITPQQFEQAGRQFYQQNAGKMYLSLNTNPVEFAGLLTALAGTFFVILFAFRTETLRERLPALETLDNLMYKTACLAFAGLAMLLITGAIWANESWGRPWGFDSKETGALVAWLTYAAFLHTRISRGWRGRSSAYFAILGFLLVIFTYLGVSYLLPGLHSYA